MKAVAIAGTCALLLSGCLFRQVGDNGIRVRGNLTGETGAVACRLELWRSGESLPYQKWPISGRFDRSFLISPQARTYFLIVRCGQEGVLAGSSSGEVLRTPAFLVKDNRYYREPIDLGDLPVPAVTR